MQCDTTPTQSLTRHPNDHCACVHLCVFNHSYYFCFSDVSIDILDELDLTHLRTTGLQPNEQELPEGEQAAPAAGKLSVFIVLLPEGFRIESPGFLIFTDYVIRNLLHGRRGGVR